MSNNISTAGNFSSGVTEMMSQNTVQNGTICYLNYCGEQLDGIREEMENYIKPAWYEWIVIIIYIITFIVGLTGNVLVCFAVWRNRQMRTVTNMFIVNLSVADLGIIIICLPPTLLVDVTETWFMGLVMCKLVYFLMTVSISVSVLTLAAIAVERWYAICRPLAFKSTRKRARIMIIVIWLVSGCVALPDILFMQLDSLVPDFVSSLLISCRPGWDQNKQTFYQVALIVLLYFLPMIFIGFAYIQIAFVLWKGDIPGESKTRTVTASSRPMMESKKMNIANDQLAARRKAAQMLISVVVAFAVCYFPVHLLNILRYAGVHKSIPENGFRAYNYIAHWLPYLNSSTNPIIYNFMSAKFRKEFFLACRCSYRITERSSSRPGMTFSSTHYSNHEGQRHSCHTEQISLTTVR
ncbi:orexin receptor type 2-like [Mytilus galloprovincialis]|uniref:orexin receptor type 2-like n=1 Tax=Mytilus galloprovincialis TaxID=29158 RepID=UPI003F7BD696